MYSMGTGEYLDDRRMDITIGEYLVICQYVYLSAFCIIALLLVRYLRFTALLITFLVGWLANCLIN